LIAEADTWMKRFLPGLVAGYYELDNFFVSPDLFQGACVDSEILVCFSEHGFI